MRVSSVLRIGFVALVLSVAGRWVYLEYGSRQNRQLTDQLCGVVGNYLESNALRPAYEGIQQGLTRVGKSTACVTVLSNGRNWGPDCIDPATKYQTTVCKAEANLGVRAEVHYVVEPFYWNGFLRVWLLIALGVGAIFEVVRAFTSYLTKRITQELETRLFSKDEARDPKPSRPVGRFVDWIFSKTGILNRIHGQTARLESQLQAFEMRTREESALRARKEAEAEGLKSYAEKVRQIRHDIRSPLSSLLSVQSALRSDELIGRSLASAIGEIQVMLDDLNLLDQEQRDPQLRIVEVMAEEVAQLIRPKFLNAKSAALSVEYDASQLAPVMIVPEALRCVLNNLLENALDAVPHSGKIAVKVSSDASVCTILVEDNGCGVPPEKIPTLFDGGSKDKINGTGRGLKQCRKLVESWNGRIEYEPLLRGSRFKFTIPLVQTGVVYIGLPVGADYWVIDDEFLLPKALVKAGHEVMEHAENVEEGRKLLAKDRGADAVTLVDQYLDGKHLGTDLIAELADRRGVYLCTHDFDNSEVIAQARRVGVKIVPKPLCLLDRPQVATSCVRAV